MRFGERWYEVYEHRSQEQRGTTPRPRRVKEGMRGGMGRKGSPPFLGKSGRKRGRPLDFDLAEQEMTGGSVAGVSIGNLKENPTKEKRKIDLQKSGNVVFWPFWPCRHDAPRRGTGD